LHSCTAAICDKIRQSAEGAIQAVTEFVSRRGSQLSDNDISRYIKACCHRRAIVLFYCYLTTLFSFLLLVFFWQDNSLLTLGSSSYNW